MKKISILGSTGSIGTQTLEVVRNHPDEFSVISLSCGRNIDLFRLQLAEFKPAFAVCSREEDMKLLSSEFADIEFAWGMDGLEQAASLWEADIVVNSLLGMMGIRPTYAAIRAGKDIAFANKETLVAGGSFITEAAAEYGAKLLPVDSEHSAIFQSLRGEGNAVKRIILTASGGPFRGFSFEQMKNVTKEQALNHPRWKMGAKITVDSATMMNKGLEIIEASLLFDVPADRIQVVVHPESILHSAVEFEDGAVVGQMGIPDMKIPIAYALSYPERLDRISESVDFFKVGTLHFEEPDPDAFKCLKLARRAIEAGHSHQIAMNAANEEAVAAFLADKISFIRIPEVIETVLDAHAGIKVADVNQIFEIEAKSRELAIKAIER